MLWDKKVHKMDIALDLMKAAGFSPGMVRRVQSLDGGVKVEAEHAYIIEDDEQEARLLRGSIEYLDTALEITAIGVSDRELRNKPVPLLEKMMSDAIADVDLLIVRQVNQASAEDQRRLKGVLYQRARDGKPTIVDDASKVKEGLKFFEKIVELTS